MSVLRGNAMNDYERGFFHGMLYAIGGVVLLFLLSGCDPKLLDEYYRQQQQELAEKDAEIETLENAVHELMGIIGNYERQGCI